MEFRKVLETVADFLEGQGIRYAVIGGFGLQALGLSRATADLDFVVEQRGQPALLSFLESLGYEALHVSEGFSNHVHPLGALGRVDFVYVDAGTSEVLFRSASAMKVLGGRAVPVPRAEHLAAMKVQAMKNDPGRGLQEMADIQFLLGLPGVDEQEVRRYFARHGLEEKFDEIKRALARTPPRA